MFVFSVMLGRVAYYGDLPDADDSLVLVPFVDTPGVLDEDLKDSLNLADLKLLLTESTAGRVTATDAYTGPGWASLENDGWASPPNGPLITRVVVVYQPTSTSIDTDIIPMVSLDVDFQPDSISDFGLNLADDGYFEATGYTYV